MIIDNSVTEVKFTELRAGDYVVADTTSGTYRLTVKGQLYTERGLVVSTIVKIEKRHPLLLDWQEQGSDIITSVKEGHRAVFAEAAGYKFPILRTSEVKSLTLIVGG